MRSARTILSTLILAGAGALAGCGDDRSPRAIAVLDADGELTVVAGTFDHDCATATALVFQCGRWQLAVHLAKEGQTGAAQPIADAPWAQYVVSDGAFDGDECTVRARDFLQGSISIDEATDGYVRFTIDGSANDAFDADGTFEATVCGDLGPSK